MPQADSAGARAIAPSPIAVVRSSVRLVAPRRVNAVPIVCPDMKLLHFSPDGLGHAADLIGAAWFEHAGNRSGGAQRGARTGEAGAVRRECSLTASEPEGRPPCRGPVVGPLVIGGSVKGEATSTVAARPSTDQGDTAQRWCRPAGAWAPKRLVGGPWLAR